MDTTITKITTLLVLIGGLHLGLLGGLGFDLFGTVLGTGMIVKLLYIIIGVSAFMHLLTDFTKKGLKK